MQTNKAYDEVIEFIAAASPENVIAFRPSEGAKARVADLICEREQKACRMTRSRNLITTCKLST
ncbi:hypothetical protein BH18ACI4_BH18ACI4_16450 [soil metagenome]